MSATQDPHDDVIDVRPLGPVLAGALSSTLARTPTLEVRRLVLARGREIPTHQAPGEITVHCLEGWITFTACGTTHKLGAGQMLVLAGYHQCSYSADPITNDDAATVDHNPSPSML